MQGVEVCAQGVCAIHCALGETNCSGGCVDLQTDDDHCGGCHTSCGSDQSCQAGLCEDEEEEPASLECDGELTECGEECVDTDMDRDHCGACGDPCGNNEICVAGGCELDPAEVVTQVLVIFLGPSWGFGHPVDIRLNDTWYYFNGRAMDDPEWSVELGDGRGEVLYLSEPLNRLELAAEQLIVDGLNLNGFGFSHFKILRRDPTSDLYNPQTSTEAGVDYWAHQNGAGRLIGAGGFNDTIFHNPEFYIFEPPASYNESGKLAIFVMGYGEHNPNFAEDCNPESSDDPCVDID